MRKKQAFVVAEHTRPYETTLPRKFDPGLLSRHIMEMECPVCGADLIFWMHWDEGAGPEFDPAVWVAELDAERSHHQFLSVDDMEVLEGLATEKWDKIYSGA